MPHGIKHSNEYCAAMRKFYEDTPKAVFAAIAYSLCSMFDPQGGGDESTDPAEVIARITREWNALHQNGIVTQSPPKPRTLQGASADATPQAGKEVQP